MDPVTQRRLLVETERLGYTHLGGSLVWHPQAGTLDVSQGDPLREARRRLRFHGSLTGQFVDWLCAKYGIGPEDQGSFDLNLRQEAREYPGEGKIDTISHNAQLDPRVRVTGGQGARAQGVTLTGFNFGVDPVVTGAASSTATGIVRQLEGMLGGDVQDLRRQLSQANALLDQIAEVLQRRG